MIKSLNGDGSGQIQWFRNGVLHRDGDEPALIKWDFRPGKVYFHVGWYRRGHLHRDDSTKPILWTYDATDIIIWYREPLRDGLIHALYWQDGQLEMDCWYSPHYEFDQHGYGLLPAISVEEFQPVTIYYKRDQQVPLDSLIAAGRCLLRFMRWVHTYALPHRRRAIQRATGLLMPLVHLIA